MIVEKRPPAPLFGGAGLPGESFEIHGARGQGRERANACFSSVAKERVSRGGGILFMVVPRVIREPRRLPNCGTGRRRLLEDSFTRAEVRKRRRSPERFQFVRTPCFVKGTLPIEHCGLFDGYSLQLIK
jgi:hypothetical protein